MRPAAPPASPHSPASAVASSPGRVPLGHQLSPQLSPCRVSQSRLCVGASSKAGSTAQCSPLQAVLTSGVDSLAEALFVSPWGHPGRAPLVHSGSSQTGPAHLQQVNALLRKASQTPPLHTEDASPTFCSPAGSFGGDSPHQGSRSWRGQGSTFHSTQQEQCHSATHPGLSHVGQPAVSKEHCQPPAQSIPALPSTATDYSPELLFTRSARPAVTASRRRALWSDGDESDSNPASLSDSTPPIPAHSMQPCSTPAAATLSSSTPPRDHRPASTADVRDLSVTVCDPDLADMLAAALSRQATVCGGEESSGSRQTATRALRPPTQLAAPAAHAEQWAASSASSDHHTPTPPAGDHQTPTQRGSASPVFWTCARTHRPHQSVRRRRVLDTDSDDSAAEVPDTDTHPGSNAGNSRPGSGRTSPTVVRQSQGCQQSVRTSPALQHRQIGITGVSQSASQATQEPMVATETTGASHDMHQRMPGPAMGTAARAPAAAASPAPWSCFKPPAARGPRAGRAAATVSRRKRSGAQDSDSDSEFVVSDRSEVSAEDGTTSDSESEYQPTDTPSDAGSPCGGSGASGRGRHQAAGAVGRRAGASSDEDTPLAVRRRRMGRTGRQLWGDSSGSGSENDAGGSAAPEVVAARGGGGGSRGQEPRVGAPSKVPAVAESLSQRLVDAMDKLTLGRRTPSIQAPALTAQAAPRAPAVPASVAAAPSRRRATKTAAEREFETHRPAIAKALYDEWNTAVFGGRLPPDLPLVWNPRLVSTAGQVLDNGSQDQLKTSREQRIPCQLELSSKILNSLGRLRATLAHEMCHVAAWAIEHDYTTPHGPAFWKWADELMAYDRRRRVQQDAATVGWGQWGQGTLDRGYRVGETVEATMQAGHAAVGVGSHSKRSAVTAAKATSGPLNQRSRTPGLPPGVQESVEELVITRLHNFETHMPYQWQCANPECNKVYQRHRNSIDTTKHVCGQCRGKLIFLGKFNKTGTKVAAATPATSANPFATPQKTATQGASAYNQFVKQTYSMVKAEHPPGTPMTVIMSGVAARWQQHKASIAAQTPAAGAPRGIPETPEGRAARSGIAKE